VAGAAKDLDARFEHAGVVFDDQHAFRHESLLEGEARPLPTNAER
jgi:hypothetical protein